MDELGNLPRAQTLSQSGITVPLQAIHNTQILVIDWHDLGSPHLQQETIVAISRVAQNWGFFQIINHGIPHFDFSNARSGQSFFLSFHGGKGIV